MRIRRNARWWALGLVVALAIGLLIGWPLAELGSVAAERGRSGLADLGRERQTLVNTLVVGGLSALISISLGLGAAFVTERTQVAGRHWLRVGILLPILVPPFVSAMSWARAYGPSGLIDDMFGIRLPGLFGPVGVVLLVSVNAIPLAYLVTVAALNSRSGRALELAARVSGAGAITTVRTVTVPLVAPALVGCAGLVFIVGINAFGVPAVLGTPASFDTATTAIYEDLVRSARPESFVRATLLATGLVAVSFVIVAIAELVLHRAGEGTASGSTAYVPDARGVSSRALAAATWTLIGLLTVFPLIALVLVAVTKGVGLAPTPDNWTLANLQDALDGRFLGALGRSLVLATITATLAVMLGAAVSALRRRRFGRTSGVIVMLSFAVPGSTLAVAMLLSYGSVLRDTLLLILLAYLAKLWAVGHRAIAGSANNLPPTLVLAARSSGARPVTAVRTVVVPLLRPAVFGAWLLVFLIAFHELTMSSLLYGPGTDTLAVAILNLQQLGDIPVSSALAVILTIPLLVAAIPMLVVGKLPRRFLGTG